MSQVVSKIVIKFMMSLMVPCNYFILCFGGQSPTFDQLFSFTGIKLKFSGSVNSGTLISYLMSSL